MKQILLGFATLLLIAIQVLAQDTPPYWSLGGNTSATSASKLGTINNINLRVYTNNLERLRISAAGLVGIGTTIPTEKLQVNSSAKTNALRVQVGGATKLLVHGNGGISIGNGSTPPTNGLYVS